MIIAIWIIGWLFTIGVSVSQDDDAKTVGFVVIVGLPLWPFLLGVMVGGKP